MSLPLLAPPIVSRLFHRRYLRRNACSTEELDRFQTLDPAAQRRLLAEKMLAQIRYFGAREDALPEWREAARITDPEEIWRVWPALPIVTRDMLRERFPAAGMGSRFGLTGQVSSTGGSTGEPTAFFHDSGMLAANNALVHWLELRMGWRPGMAIITVWGSERDIGRGVPWKVRRHYNLTRQMLIDGYQLTPETAARVVAGIERYRPVAVYGFTSMLEEVARLTLTGNLHVSTGAVAVAWNGGEALLESQSELFRRAFGVPILNRYGSREIGGIACQFRAGEALAVSRPWCFVEIVDDAGRPVAAGQSGRVLVTSTVCRGTPFLRYVLGDLASAEPSLITEAGIGGLRQIDGRIAGMIDLPDGRRVNNLFWNHALKEFTEIVQFQVTLRKDDTLLLRLRGSGMDPQREAELRRLLNHLLAGFRLEIQWVTQIPLTVRGKLLQVVNEKTQ